jgi:hypothetical protein
VVSHRLAQFQAAVNKRIRISLDAVVLGVDHVGRSQTDSDGFSSSWARRRSTSHGTLSAANWKPRSTASARGPWSSPKASGTGDEGRDEPENMRYAIEPMQHGFDGVANVLKAHAELL